MSINLEKNSIRTIIKHEKLQICVVCYGGCSSNTLITPFLISNAHFEMKFINNSS